MTTNEINMILVGVWQTVYMTLVSTLFGYVLGLPWGIALTVTAKDGLHPNKVVYRILDIAANIMRSVPFLIMLILGCSLMTLTTTPNELTDAMERVFAFLGVLHVPVHEIAMMMSIALRFIPILTEETDKIRKAQMARGADFESGKFIERMRAMIPLLVPLFVSAFRRANDLALAMEARCYHGGEGRTRMKPLRYRKRDAAAYALAGAYLAACIVLGVLKL